MNSEPITSRITKNQGIGLVLGVLGLILSIVGFVTARTEFFHAYMFAWVFWVCLTIGCFGLTMFQHIVRAQWGMGTLRLLEAGGGPVNLLLMAVFFIPILLGMHDIYHWTHTEVVRNDPVLSYKTWWLNTPGFIIRTVLYFAFYIGVSALLRKWSLEQDRTGDYTLAQKRTNVSSGAVVIFFLVGTVAFTDWVMSLSPHWFSTVFGLWIVVCQGLAAYAFITLLLMQWRNLHPFSEADTPGARRDLGNMMLTFTMLWAYLALSQFLIMWSGNLAEETMYYKNRGQGDLNPLNVMGGFLLIGQFFLPFLLLLSGRTKREPHLIRNLCLWLLFIRVVDMYWTIIPFFPLHEGVAPGSIPFHWTQIATFVGMGGIWYAVYMMQLKKAPLLAHHAPRLQEALEHA